MKHMTKLLTMLLTLAVLIGAMALTASAAQFSEEDAFAYLDSYADNVGVDEDFDENIAAALAAARETARMAFAPRRLLLAVPSS